MLREALVIRRCAGRRGATVRICALQPRGRTGSWKNERCTAFESGKVRRPPSKIGKCVVLRPELSSQYDRIAVGPFQHLPIRNKDHHYDDWIFSWMHAKGERKRTRLLLNICTIATPPTAFDGGISRIEAANMRMPTARIMRATCPGCMQSPRQEFEGGRLKRRGTLQDRFTEGYSPLGEAGQSLICLFVDKRRMEASARGECCQRFGREIQL